MIWCSNLRFANHFDSLLSSYPQTQLCFVRRKAKDQNIGFGPEYCVWWLGCKLVEIKHYKRNFHWHFWLLIPYIEQRRKSYIYGFWLSYLKDKKTTRKLPPRRTDFAPKFQEKDKIPGCVRNKMLIWAKETAISLIWLTFDFSPSASGKNSTSWKDFDLVFTNLHGIFEIDR